MTPTRAIESFLDMMSAERGASPNTLSAYARDLADLQGALQSTGQDLMSAGAGHIEAVLAKWAGSGWHVYSAKPTYDPQRMTNRPLRARLLFLAQGLHHLI